MTALSGSGGPTRRAFLAAGSGALLAGLGGFGWRSERPEPRDSRLTARPGIPTTAVEPGEHQLVPELERGALLYVPETYDPASPAPLLVMLHGAGGRAGSWSRLYAQCDRRGLLMLATDSRGRTWDAVRGAFGPDVTFLDSMLVSSFERCAVDAGRIALGGFSDGASYALSLGPSNGDLFSHLIAFSPGFSYPEEPIVGRPRVFISHGSEDGVLPVTLSRDGLAPMFDMDGYDVRYEEFGGGHRMPVPILDTALDWFLA